MRCNETMSMIHIAKCRVENIHECNNYNINKCDNHNIITPIITITSM